MELSNRSGSSCWLFPPGEMQSSLHSMDNASGDKRPIPPGRISPSPLGDWWPPALDGGGEMNEGGRRPLDMMHLSGLLVGVITLHHCTIARPRVPVSRHVICMFSPLSCLANIPWAATVKQRKNASYSARN